MSKFIRNGAKSKRAFQPPPPTLSQVPRELSYLYESPRKDKNLLAPQLRPTTIARSPQSKNIEQFEFTFPLHNPYLLKTPGEGAFQEMMFLRTPDHSCLRIEGAISIQKLDFGEDIITSNQGMETIKSISSDEYESVGESEEEESQTIEKENVSVISDSPAKIEIEEIHPDHPEVRERTLCRNLPHDPPNGKTCCNCKKSKCIKLYCDCFRSNKLCTNCSCGDCLNQSEKCEERFKAIAIVLEMNPDGFQPKIRMEKHTKGCNCKKSGCHKRYCECYQAGLSCSDLCKCTECKNHGGECKDKRKGTGPELTKHTERTSQKLRSTLNSKGDKTKESSKILEKQLIIA